MGQSNGHRDSRFLRYRLEQDGRHVDRSDRIHCPNPQHEDKNPSCRLFDDEHGGHLHCFACGYHADAYQYLTDIAGLQPREALDLLDGPNAPRPSPRSGARPTAAKPAHAIAPIKTCTTETLPTVTIAMHDARVRNLHRLPAALDDRGFTLQDAHRLRIAGENEDAIFAITGPDAQTVALKRRRNDSQPRYRYDTPDLGTPAWCSPSFRDRDVVLIVEGELNGMACWLARPELAVVGVAGTNGSLPLPAIAGRTVVLYADDDRPGRDAIAKWTATLQARECHVYLLEPWDDGDACDIAGRLGRHELRRRLT